jgi:hypothetical protein
MPHEEEEPTHSLTPVVIGLISHRSLCRSLHHQINRV